MKTSLEISLRVCTLTALLLAPGSRPGAWAQGALTPPGAPAPTMRSLQEIWDKIGVLETQGLNLQTQGLSLQQQVSGLQKDCSALSLLLDNAEVTLPWLITTVDSAGFTGEYTSLAFTPGAAFSPR